MRNNFYLDFNKLNYIKDIYKFTSSEEKFYKTKIGMLDTYVRNGDVQPAFVYNINPLIISTYNDEIDNILLLEFPNEFVTKYELKVGDRLLSANVYTIKRKPTYKDILPGVGNKMRYNEIYPLIIKFLIKDDYNAEKYVFSDFIWEYVENLTHAYFKFSEGKPRDGFFYLFKGDKRGK